MRLIAGLVLAVLVYVAFGGVMIAAAGPLPHRGEMIDVGGRRMRIVCMGPKDTDKPTIILEAGAFGFAADFGTVQDQLTAKGLKNCAYDRAGMGYSDPSPDPRDGVAIAEDLEKLLAAARIAPPYVLVGHSLAGLRLREFAGRNPGEVAGVVLVDATTPEALQDPGTREFVGHFATASRWAGIGASAGVFAPLMGTGMANKIGLTGEAEREKRHFFANGRHNRTAAAEVTLWPKASEQAAATPPFRPEIPVAVITAGAAGGWNAGRKATQAAPANASAHGYVDHVAGAGHNTLLGPLYADHIVRGVDFVLANLPAR
ncbi:MAG: alpha/beta fold hydrolase [Caulobacteraceae bacterium]